MSLDMAQRKIKVGMLTKRSQQKKSIGPVNYKERVFVLTKEKLCYYEGEMHNRGRLKGSIMINEVNFVGPLDDQALKKANSFQIGHKSYILYCTAKTGAERDDWLRVLKDVCSINPSSYHPLTYSNKTWLCCGATKKDAPGCTAPTKTYPSHLPLPTVPESLPPNYIPAAGSTGNYPAHYPQHQSVFPKQPQHNPSNYPIHQPSYQTNQPSYPPNQPSYPPNQPSYPSNQCNYQPNHSNYQPTQSNYPQYQPDFLNNNSPSQQTPMSVSINELTSKLSNHINNNPSVCSYPKEQAPEPPPRKSPIEGNKKVVIAMYPFKPCQENDIELIQGDKYYVVDDMREHWWKVRNFHGEVGYVPANYVEELGIEIDKTDVTKQDWFQKDISRPHAERILKEEDKEGCFVVRKSSQPDSIYTLSVASRSGVVNGKLCVKHYHIKKNDEGYYFSEKHILPTVVELIEYHQHNAGGLVTRLRLPPNCFHKTAPPLVIFNDEWEIDMKDLELSTELGSGQFGVVRLATYRRNQKVAVKMMREGAMEEDSFIEEAEVMTKLNHRNLVQLYGVVIKQRPICIVTEYMENGCLLSYVRSHSELKRQPHNLLEMCLQVCDAMRFLEENNLIHRDLAARNCLVGKDLVVKVSDFGLTRFVPDDEYTTSAGSKFPIKWASPEVLQFATFSTKSDVWAFGVLMWELFSGGKMPYIAWSNHDVAEKVPMGYTLEKPSACPSDVYSIMKQAWVFDQANRPPFSQIYELIYQTLENMQIPQ